MNRPIAAFSMSDYENLTRNPYQAAEFRRGKDKKKRKRRGALATAGMVAGGLAGAAGLGAAARYGGAAASTALAQRRLYNGASVSNRKSNKLDDWKNMKMDVNTGRNAASGGAKGQLDRDVKAVKDFGSKVKNYDYKGIPGRVGGAFQKTGDYASRGYQIGKGDAKGIRGVARGVMGGASAALGTKVGKIAAGLSAAGLAAGAGYGAYRMMNKKKKK